MGFKERLIIGLANLTVSKILIWMLFLAFVIEIITLFLRFGLGMQATRDTTMIAKFTFGIRIHHGYIGVILLLIAWLWASSPSCQNFMFILGGALLISDLVHHFFVLYPITGSSEFDLVYPDRNKKK